MSWDAAAPERTHYTHLPYQTPASAVSFTLPPPPFHSALPHPAQYSSGPTRSNATHSVPVPALRAGISICPCGCCWSERHVTCTQIDKQAPTDVRYEESPHLLPPTHLHTHLELQALPRRRVLRGGHQRPLPLHRPRMRRQGARRPKRGAGLSSRGGTGPCPCPCPVDAAGFEAALEEGEREAF